MKFLIATPRYLSNSNGIKTLHKLCHTINELGGDARLVFIDPHSANPQELVFHDETWTNPAPDFKTPVLSPKDIDFIGEAYVLYPETIMRNPLKSDRVIRYFGNREGYCNSEKVFTDSKDFILAHSTAIHSKPHYVLFNAEINPCFNDIEALPFQQRKLDVTYIGKGYIYGKTGVIPNSLYVAREWPQSQEQLALLLKQTRFMFTWDCWTSTNVEAVLCGAVPIVLAWEPWTAEEVDSSELGWLPRADILHDQVALDVEKFMKGRAAMIGKIDGLSQSWDARVGEFMEAVGRHFK